MSKVLSKRPEWLAYGSDSTLERPQTRILLLLMVVVYSGVPIFRTSKENEIGEFEKSGLKLQCSTEEGKQLLVRVIGRLKK